jgi:folate-dependent tRNA-U54 methylase TrmFO/GidA
MRYISDPERKHFQPMNISFGLMASYFEGSERKSDKKLRRLRTSEAALAALTEFRGHLAP